MKLSEQEVEMLLDSIEANIGHTAQVIVHRDSMIAREKNPEMKEELNIMNIKDTDYFYKLEDLKSKLKGGI